MDKAQLKVLKDRGIVWEDLNKGMQRQPKATYYKPNGEVFPNLPADPASMQSYLDRGLTLVPPENKPETTSELQCEVCRKVCANKIGLMGHMRSHTKK